MKKSTIVLLSVGGLFVLMIMWAISVNNSLVSKDETVQGAWAQVENVYQRRADLIPNLVSTVKGYAKHEKETLENVIKARNMALQANQGGAAMLSDPSKLKQFQNSQSALGSALSRLLVVVERYPNLKANENFRDLQSQLEGTENRIAVERRRFNEATKDYNKYIRFFPQSIFASMRGFTKKAYFEVEAGSEKAPQVDFN